MLCSHDCSCGLTANINSKNWKIKIPGPVEFDQCGSYAMDKVENNFYSNGYFGYIPHFINTMKKSSVAVDSV